MKIATRTARFLGHFLRLNFTPYMGRIGNLVGNIVWAKNFQISKNPFQKLIDISFPITIIITIIKK